MRPAFDNVHNRPMSNLIATLKDEISRIARKEVRAELESLKKASVGYRSAIAGLRRQVASLEKELRLARKSANRGDHSQPDPESSGPGAKRRFSAQRLAAHRAKLGLSAAQYGRLVGVSGQSIYLWEQGKMRPRPAQIERLAHVKELSRRETAELLASS